MEGNGKPQKPKNEAAKCCGSWMGEVITSEGRDNSDSK